MADSLTQMGADGTSSGPRDGRRVATKAAAILLLVIGGLIWLAATLALIAAVVYFDVELIKALFHGDVFQALIGIPIATGIAIFVGSLLQMPGALLLAAAEEIWPPARERWELRCWYV